MKHYGHANYKRTRVWSTSFAVWRLNMGKMSAKKIKNGPQTVRKYTTKSGAVGYTGTRALKQTQLFGRLLVHDFSGVDFPAVWIFQQNHPVQR